MSTERRSAEVTNVTPLHIDGEITANVCRTIMQEFQDFPDMHQEVSSDYLHHIQPSLYRFAQGMHELRNTLDCDYNFSDEEIPFPQLLEPPIDMERATIQQSSKSMQSYINGALLMTQILYCQYRSSNRDFPVLSDARLGTLFMEFIGGEDNHHEIEVIKDQNRIAEANNLTPQKLNDIILNDRADSLAVKRVTDTFQANSDNLVGDFWNNQEGFRESLLQSKFVSIFKPIKGIIYGASDVFRAFQVAEEMNSLDKWLDIELR